MWLRRLVWILPLMALGILEAQIEALLHAPSLGTPVVIGLIAVDVLFLLAVWHVFRALRGTAPPPLSTLFLGAFGLGILARVVSSADLGRSPHLAALLGIFSYSALGLTVWAWVRRGAGKEKASFRTWLSAALFLGLLTWVILLVRSLSEAKDGVPWRSLVLAAIAVPVLLFFLHLADRLIRRVRLSDGMLLLGMFVILPGGWLGPLMVLGGTALAPCALWFYFGGVVLVGLVVAWSKGEKPASSTSAPPDTC